MKIREFVKRVRRYAQQTQIQLRPIGDRKAIQELGIADVRGFTPHLREVRVPSNLEEPWLIHDLLHIAFYDFVTLNLGPESWREPERFIESHLASEAFAVLLLDYFILSQQQGASITVEVDDVSWERFQTENPKLPNLRSWELIESIVELYLTGEVGRLAHGSPSAVYDRWLGHEIRYSKKQRHYVQLWLSDLEMKSSGPHSIEIHQSYVAEAVAELIEIFLTSSERAWERHLSMIRKKVEKLENVFAQFPKYRSDRIQEPPDFRLTSRLAVSGEQIQEWIEGSDRPSASLLFLFWQILYDTEFSNVSLMEQELIGRLARESQSSQIDPVLWRKVRDIVSRLFEVRFHQQVQPRYRSAFFLP